GLGGAGTFSDGKLTTSLGHPWIPAVLRVLVECGAPADIEIDARPHVGTDVLGGVVTRLVSRIEAAGGAVRTSVRVDGVGLSGGRVDSLETPGGRVEARVVVLAIGHSARDMWTMLARTGIGLEAKPFQMGIRVEHPQAWLDRTQYRSAAGHPALGAADYRLATRVRGVPVFSFCMCPGGETMPTVNEAGHLALNGMSRSVRDSAFASSGLVVTLEPDVYGGRDLASCLAFQRAVEAACFAAGGRDYTAPAERLADFAAGRDPGTRLPVSSYPLGVRAARLHEILPPFVAGPLRAALPSFDRSLPGYLHKDALALAPESRASSPIRIVRDAATGGAPGASGLYPVGEGAGHAGGIMSSALDGLNAARRIIERFGPP
ncbi:MAG: FAD-dependent oxidoreductase, partial [Deltaproteobacteria bacterium]|nr:FAD-dependent oxidoreductase [Deltaproteobacteria bacterium]